MSLTPLSFFSYVVDRGGPIALSPSSLFFARTLSKLKPSFVTYIIFEETYPSTHDEILVKVLLVT